MPLDRSPAAPKPRRGRRGDAPARDPARTRARLLEAARAVFAGSGLNGARVNEIADRAGVNKQLVYYYFGSKEGLYVAVLEDAYARIREREQALRLTELDPWDAIGRLVGFTFDYCVENRDFVALLNDENLHRARHLADSSRLRDLHSGLRRMIAATLARGEAAGLFRTDVDPLELYLSIASLCYFHLSNTHTLSAVFGSDLDAAPRLAARRRHVLEMVAAFLRR